MPRPDFLTAALAALDMDTVGDRPAPALRGNRRQADARRIAVALATTHGYTRKEAATAAGLSDRTTAAYHLRKHRDLLETDPAYAEAYTAARALLLKMGGGAGVAVYGRAHIPGETHRIHAVGMDGVAVCGTDLAGRRSCDNVRIGPADLIGRRALQGVLCIGPEEVPRFVTCARCLRSLLTSPETEG